MIPSQRYRRPNRTFLTPRQREIIQTGVNQLRPDKQYSAILRIEEHLQMRGRSITDALVSDIVNRVVTNMVNRP